MGRVDADLRERALLEAWMDAINEGVSEPAELIRDYLLPVFAERDLADVAANAKRYDDGYTDGMAERERQLRERLAQDIRTLRDRDCPYLGNYKLGYDAALDDLLAVVRGVGEAKP